MIGVPSSLVSGRGPRVSVLKRQATSILLKLVALTWSSGEYLLPRRSAVYIGHSPFLVLGWPVPWPNTSGLTHTSPAASSAAAGTTRIALRFIRFLLLTKRPGMESHPAGASPRFGSRIIARINGVPAARTRPRYFRCFFVFLARNTS